MRTTLKIPAFQSISHLWEACLAELVTSQEDQSRVGGVRRLQGFCARIERPNHNILLNTVRKFNLRYALGELCWYLTANPTMEQITHYAPSYANYAEDTSAFYGGRIHSEAGNQLHTVAAALREDPTNRRCVVAVWAKEDLFNMGRKDIPCTISWKFNVCNNKLNMIADMRSNDAWLGMPNDIFVNTCIHILMSKLTGYKLGFYQHQAADLHLYDRNFDKAIAALSITSSFDVTPLGNRICNLSDLYEVLYFENRVRLGVRHYVNVDLLDSFFRFIAEGLIQR